MLIDSVDLGIGEIFNVNRCAAKMGLGNVVHIEDVNPDMLMNGNDGRVIRQVERDDTDGTQAFDRGSITIGATVLVSFTISDEE